MLNGRFHNAPIRAKRTEHVDASLRQKLPIVGRDCFLNMSSLTEKVTGTIISLTQSRYLHQHTQAVTKGEMEKVRYKFGDFAKKYQSFL